MMVTVLAVTLISVCVLVKSAPPAPIRVSPQHVHFYHHPAPSSSHISPTNTTEFPALNQSLPTVILIHGWRESGLFPWIKQLAQIYHHKSAINVLSIDWSKYSGRNYLFAAAVVPVIGKLSADYFSKLILQNGIDVTKTHLVGHSLGAHVAGVMGQHVTKLGLGQIDRITGLDASGPLFEYPVPRSLKARLNKGDANFVDFVHTDVGLQGAYFSYGDVDFYVNNGGPFQPGCNMSIGNGNLWRSTTCSHKGARVYFAKAMLHPWDYVGIKCENRWSYRVKNCDFEDTAIMGEYVSRKAAGTFFLETNSSAVDPNM